MTPRHSRRASTDRIASSDDAAALAYDELTDAGCHSVIVETPRQTRGTWVVHARCGDGECPVERWRVHVDPRSGSSRIVPA